MQHADFIDKITGLQRQRLREPVGDARVHDRSPLCTVALAQYLGHPVTPLLAGEVARMIREQIYEQPVFLLCPLGSSSRRLRAGSVTPIPLNSGPCTSRSTWSTASA